ncbi:hypothetical protein SFR_3975 [Streptomyces sp. FR-008]|nr:hypothetical protein SFR_3975 [Streptomyces sp. FR-008]
MHGLVGGAREDRPVRFAEGPGDAAVGLQHHDAAPVDALDEAGAHHLGEDRGPGAAGGVGGGRGGTG